jgi:hypothetical protein
MNHPDIIKYIHELPHGTPHPKDKNAPTLHMRDDSLLISMQHCMPYPKIVLQVTLWEHEQGIRALFFMRLVDGEFKGIELPDWFANPPPPDHWTRMVEVPCRKCSQPVLLGQLHPSELCDWCITETIESVRESKGEQAQ